MTKLYKISGKTRDNYQDETYIVGDSEKEVLSKGREYLGLSAKSRQPIEIEDVTPKVRNYVTYTRKDKFNDDTSSAYVFINGEERYIVSNSVNWDSPEDLCWGRLLTDIFELGVKIGRESI